VERDRQLRAIAAGKSLIPNGEMSEWFNEHV
jgi:hypothetical protein